MAAKEIKQLPIFKLDELIRKGDADFEAEVNQLGYSKKGPFYIHSSNDFSLGHGDGSIIANLYLGYDAIFLMRETNDITLFCSIDNLSYYLSYAIKSGYTLTKPPSEVYSERYGQSYVSIDYYKTLGGYQAVSLNIFNSRMSVTRTCP